MKQSLAMMILGALAALALWVVLSLGLGALIL